MKKLIKHVVAPVFVISVLIAGTLVTRRLTRDVVEEETISASSFPSIEEPASALPSEGFRGYVTTAFKSCNSPISEARASVLADQLVVLVPRYLENPLHQELFVIALCMENNFTHGRKSPVGAVGIAQIMPQYAQDFANLCGLGKLEASDVEDPTVNLTLGLCYFKHLISTEKYPTLALASYNAGPNSEALKSLKKLGSMNGETANYLAKASFLKEKINADQALGSND